MRQFFAQRKLSHSSLAKYKTYTKLMIYFCYSDLTKLARMNNKVYNFPFAQE